MSHAELAETVSGRLMAILRARKRETQTTVENLDYVAMLWRMIRAAEARTIEDPEMLPQIIALAQRMDEIVNVAIAANAERYAVDPKLGASMKECARILGITPQSASERKKRGEAIMGRRLEDAGVVRFSEARREREAIDKAAEYAVTSLIDYRARHRAAS